MPPPFFGCPRPCCKAPPATPIERGGDDDGLSDDRDPGRERPAEPGPRELWPAAPALLVACSSDMPIDSMPRKSLLEGLRDGFPISDGSEHDESDLPIRNPVEVAGLDLASGPVTFEVFGRVSGTSSCRDARAAAVPGERDDWGLADAM